MPFGNDNIYSFEIVLIINIIVVISDDKLEMVFYYMLSLLIFLIHFHLVDTIVIYFEMLKIIINWLATKSSGNEFVMSSIDKNTNKLYHHIPQKSDLNIYI